MTLKILGTLAIVAGLVIRSSVGHSVIPEIPNEIFLETFTSHQTTQYYDLTMTLSEPTIQGLSSFHDEFSLNCLSGDYEYAIKFPDGRTTIEYNIKGNVILLNPPVLAHININGHLYADTCFVFDACTLYTTGRLQMDHPGYVQLEDMLFDTYYFQTTVNMTSGLVNLVPIEEVTEVNKGLLLDFINIVAAGALRGKFTSILQSTVENIFSNTTTSDLITLSNGDCLATQEGAQRSSIIPPLPAVIPMDTVTHFEGHDNISMTSTKTIYGLDQMQSELSFNCITNFFEMAFVVPNLTIQGPVFMDRLHIAENGTTLISLNATGFMTQTCESNATSIPTSREVGPCLLTASGTLRDQLGRVAVENVFLQPTFQLVVQFSEGFVNGEPLNEETQPIIDKNFDHLRFSIEQQNQAHVSDFLKTLMAEMTIAEIVAKTGGQCSDI